MSTISLKGEESKTCRQNIHGLKMRSYKYNVQVRRMLLRDM